MPDPTTRSERQHALLYPILVGGVLMGLALGIRHVQGLFMLPMTMDHGWPRETFAFALALQNLVWGIAQPFTGMLADRWGTAKIVAAGALLYGLGLLLMSTATSPAALYLGGGVVIGLALSCTAFGVVYGALSRLSTEADRSWSLGLAGAIGGLGQFIAVPGTQALQDALGWERALVSLGAMIGLLVLFASKLDDRVRVGTVQAAGAPRPLPMAAAISQAFAHRGFWLLNLGFLACGFQLAFIAAHLPAYLLDKGVHPSVAVTGLAIIALSNVVGTFVCGQLGDQCAGGGVVDGECGHAQRAACAASRKSCNKGESSTTPSSARWNSGCHCTALTQAPPVWRMASTTPSSGDSASTAKPGARSLMPWWWTLLILCRPAPPSRPASRVPGTTPAAAIAAVSSIGYSGFLVGPPLIGSVAQAVSLTAALSLVVVAMVALALGAGGGAVTVLWCTTIAT